MTKLPTSVCIFCVVMIGTECGFAPSSDCIAQTLDPSSAAVFCSASHNIVFAAMVVLFIVFVSSNTGPAGI